MLNRFLVAIKFNVGCLLIAIAISIELFFFFGVTLYIINPDNALELLGANAFGITMATLGVTQIFKWTKEQIT